METMSVTRMEKREVEWMQPRFVSADSVLAEGCERRKHVVSFLEYYGGYFLNGKHVGGTHFERKAVRREKKG